MTDELDTTIGGEAAANPPSETGDDAEFEAKLEAEHLAFTSALYERLVVGQDGDVEAADCAAQSSAAEPDAAVALSNAVSPLDCVAQSSAVESDGAALSNAANRLDCAEQSLSLIHI